MRKVSTGFFALVLLTGAKLALAHAVVSPSSADVAQTVTFSLSVPSEKPQATVSVRLLLPDGLNYVTPFVQAGWQINLIKTGGDPNSTDPDSDPTVKVTEIDWTGGSIPSGQKDLFLFSAQVAAKATTLNWKAYQTYADGSMVAWDQDPNSTQASIDLSKTGPYSTTKIIDDLGASTDNTVTDQAALNKKINWVMALSIAALSIALSSFICKYKRIK